MVTPFNYQLYYERYRHALQERWEISTDNSIIEENKVKMIRDVLRAYLDGSPTTADEHNVELEKDIKNDLYGTEEFDKVYISDINKEIADEMNAEYKAGKAIFGGDTGIDADFEAKCEHKKTTYQAPEEDTNVPELYTCDDCGEDLDLPEQDWDLMNKE